VDSKFKILDYLTPYILSKIDRISPKNFISVPGLPNKPIPILL